MLGAVLPRARYSGMLKAAALFYLEVAFVNFYLVLGLYIFLGQASYLEILVILAAA
jgi:hypothetical protein